MGQSGLRRHAEDCGSKGVGAVPAMTRTAGKPIVSEPAPSRRGSRHVVRRDRKPNEPSLNEEVEWDHFNSEAYFTRNYRTLRKDDQEILTIIRDFFAAAKIAPNAAGLDVGSGTNLYPALAMLPFCAHLELREFSSSNVRWLEQQVAEYDRNWDEFWDVLAENKAYAAVADPRAALRGKAVVRQRDIFKLPPRRWDVGTMFFVACSLSTHVSEFRSAVGRFVGALRPKSPFAAAFMAKSEGYFVGDLWFPAVAIDADEVRQCLWSFGAQLHQVEPIDIGDPLRDGYGGMIVVTGRTADHM
jgi:hypothetical protein